MKKKVKRKKITVSFKAVCRSVVGFLQRAGSRSTVHRLPLSQYDPQPEMTNVSFNVGRCLLTLALRICD